MLNFILLTTAHEINFQYYMHVYLVFFFFFVNYYVGQKLVAQVHTEMIKIYRTMTLLNIAIVTPIL
jgi:hypothetical protein